MLAQLVLVVEDLAEGDVAVGGVLDLLHQRVALLQLEGEGAVSEDASGELLGGVQAGCSLVRVELALSLVDVGEGRCSADNLVNQFQHAVSSVFHLNGEGEHIG